MPAGYPQLHKRSFWTRVGFWTLYPVIVSALVLAVLEGVVRLFLPAPALPQQYSKNVSDPYLPWKPEPLSLSEGRTAEFPFSYRHNSVGFRDVEHAIQKPPGTIRILGLGDSFTYGVGATFEQTYLFQVERLLSEHFRGRPPVEIIKAGIPRYWPEPERLLLDHYGVSYSPDLVVVAFLPNDVLDTFNGVKGLTVNQGFLINRHLDALGTAAVWLFIHSELFRTLFFPYVNARIANERSRSVQTRPADIYVEDGFHAIEWRKIAGEYSRMERSAAHAGAKMAVVHIPQKGPWESPEFEYPAWRLAGWSAAHGVAFIDTLPALKRASAREPQYYPIDGHCTPAGYRTIAEAVSSALLRSRLHPIQ